MKLDLYAIIGVDTTATEDEVNICINFFQVIFI